MIRTLAAHVRDTAAWLGTDTLSDRVIEALRDVPRHAFVPLPMQARAYDDAALPIDHGQTISQPYIVAISSELVSVGADDRVLDVGTGCGYQAAILARLARQVVSIERIPALAEAAAERLARLGFDNVEVAVGDGWNGLPEAAPFDGIVVAASASELPDALVEQLAPGARLVVPVAHDLLVVEKDEAGAVRVRKTIPVAFVPLRHGIAGRE